ncbi:sugar kinase [Aeromicrobium sp.]|uniref:sugar kinase n=1 Tax=Aeromicrobium sp. TaxID=1871063 RepID=UPI0019CE44DD|nr:sugar kinase [Aeromicrobium sp.]MBC7630341.1 sugar kinase [Aeromicrobium sp.]
MPTAVCIGETMAMLTPALREPLYEATELLFGIGGAESNVAMGLASMGVDAHWVGRVGSDGFGTRILRDLQAHGVGTEGVEVDLERPTGLYVKVPAMDGPADDEDSVLYYRQGSAASAMSPDTLDNPAVLALMDQATLIHLSGITAALSPACLALSRTVLKAPRDGRTISFDVNWRPTLWAEQDRTILRELADLADLVLVGRDEAEHAFGSGDEAELRSLLPEPSMIVIKNSDVSAVALGRDGTRVEVTALTVDVVDAVGAGDAFAAGCLSGLLLGLDAEGCLRRGHISACCTLIVKGDRGPLPPEEEMTRILGLSDMEWASTTLAEGRFTAVHTGTVAT